MSLLSPTIIAANTTMWISALLYSPLYTAPSPGKKPSANATPGLTRPRPATGAAGNGKAGGSNGAPAGVAGAGPGGIAAAGAGNPIIVARQSSQYSTSRTGRTHVPHIAFPQFRQYPTASTSVWTAHFIAFSSSTTRRSPAPALPPALPGPASLHPPGSAAAAKTANSHPNFPGFCPAPSAASPLPAS